MEILKASPVLLISILATTNVYAETSENSWQGLYSGVSLGSLEGKATPDSEAKNNVSNNYFEDQDVVQLNTALQQQLKSRELSGSILVGYNIQNGPWVYGIEADITLADYYATNSESVVYDTVAEGNIVAHLQTTIEMDYALSARVQAGYAVNDLMFHAGVGPVVSQFTYKTSYRETGSQSSVSTPEYFNNSNTAVGVSFNIATTYQLDDNWLLRGDYIYNYYPEIINERHEFDVTVKETTYNAVLDHKSDFESHNVRVAFIRSF